MAAESVGRVLKRRSLGVLLIVVVLALLSLSVAFYKKAFTSTTDVTLQTDSVGNQLQPQSDVKLRGIIVGEVRSVSSRGEGADITLSLKPDMTKLIPANVSAQLLPKTLFGERYVALILPSAPDAAIKAGDVIPQDRSSSAIELEKVFNDVLPLLQAVKPAELNATLNALATALSGRGAELGANLAALDEYLKGIEPAVPQLLDDLGKLGEVSTLYNRVAPDLLATLSNLQTTSRTISEKATQLDGLLVNGTQTAQTLKDFLDANGDRLITVADGSAKLLDVLAEYSPEYPCLAAGLALSEKRLESAFGGQSSGPRALNITLEVVKPRGKYVPADAPRFGTIPGPDCQGLPNPTVPFPAEGYGEGRGLDGAAAVGDASSGALPSVLRAAQGGGALSTAEQASIATSGSTSETRTINALIAGPLGVSPGAVPPIATVLAGPILRGSEVSGS
ncbi:MCE family protein [Jatrophihabitans sp. YIM 134969]